MVPDPKCAVCNADVTAFVENKALGTLAEAARAEADCEGGQDTGLQSEPSAKRLKSTPGPLESADGSSQSGPVAPLIPCVNHPSCEASVWDGDEGRALCATCGTDYPFFASEPVPLATLLCSSPPGNRSLEPACALAQTHVRIAQEALERITADARVARQAVVQSADVALVLAK